MRPTEGTAVIWDEYDEDGMQEGEMYGENITDIIKELREDRYLSLKDNWMNSKWKKFEIKKLLALFEPFKRKVVDVDQLWKLSTQMKRFGRKLDFSGSKSTLGTFNHTYGLLEYAVFLINHGCNVHLLEATDCSGRQHMSDVDLVYSKDGKFYQCDFTSDWKLRRGKVHEWSPEQKDDKYSKLRKYLEDGFVPLVVSFGSSYNFDFTLLHNMVTDTSREDDFKFCDSIFNSAHNVTLQEARSMLEHYASSVSKDLKHRSEMISTAPHYSTRLAGELLIAHSGTNNPTSAGIYKKWHDDIAMEEDVSSYSHSFTYNNLRDKSTVPPIAVPELKRGSHETDPFQRLANVLPIAGLSTGIDAFTHCVSQLATVDSYRFEEELVSSYVASEYLVGTVFKRIKIEDVRRHCYSVTFPLSKSLKGFQEFKKGVFGSERKILEHVGLEEQLDTSWKDLLQPSTGSHMMEDVDEMVDDVLPDGHLASEVRTIMRDSYRGIKNSRVVSMLSQVQEMTYAILNGPRKRKALKTMTMGGVKGEYIVMGLDNISDRAGVVTYNMGPLTFGDIKDVTYMVMGDFNTQANDMVRKTLGGSTRVLSSSHAYLDWNSTQLVKGLSWLGLSNETVAASRKNYTELQTNIARLPLLVMFTNSAKFSQFSETVRYFYVNATGLSSGPGPLFEKISWYQPKTHVEKLYAYRLMKMTDTANLAKSLNLMSRLQNSYRSVVVQEREKRITTSLDEWNLAMPDEEIASLNEQHVFNSFYTCRALTIQRYNKTLSEALVLEKQLDARDEYIRVKALNLPHEGRNRDLITDKDHLIKTVFSVDFSKSLACPYSPDPIVVYLGYLSTILKLSKPKDVTVNQVRNRVYKMDSVMYKMDLSSTMNSRGSVRDQGVNGYARTVDRVTVNDKGEKKVIKCHQNSKCYKTLLNALNNMVKGILPPHLNIEFTEAMDAEQITKEAEKLDFAAIACQPDRLWPLILYFSNTRAACVSKMVHKDQIGTREIAVLNAASRVMCKYVEQLARHVRDMEHNNQLFTNLIEIKDKTKFIKQAIGVGLSNKKMGRMVAFDSADCSKWGPSMMPHILYLTLLLRFGKGENVCTLRNCLALFSAKVFKIPDNFYLLKDDQYDGGKIAEVRDRLKNMPKEVGSWKDQIIYLEESMHQGILGCSSSVLGSDAQNLSNFVTSFFFKFCNMNTVSHITSDDYSRVLTWNREAGGIYKVGKSALSMHTEILNQFGIKRNQQKSGLSTTYFEFNSVFYTASGEFKPDIKSRLSYIDYHHVSDPYDIALRPMSMSNEYLRSEGSFIGACWVFLLNNLLAMYQNQSRRLWKTNGIGANIYKIPLELGGLIKPDPALASVSSQFLPLAKNYEPYENAPLKMTLSTMLESESYSPELVDIGDENHTIEIPSLSRSGTIHLCRKPNRSERAIREFLLEIDQNEFSELYDDRFSGSMIYALVACAQRENQNPYDEGSSFRYMVTQTQRNAPVYRVNSDLLRDLGASSDKICRDELHRLAIVFLTERARFTYELEEWDTIAVALWESAREMHSRVMKCLKPLSLNIMPRFTEMVVWSETYASPTFVKDKIMQFEEIMMPKVFGGESDLHPWTFLEARSGYRQKLMKLTKRKQMFRWSIRNDDSDCKNMIEKMLTSDTAAGCRLIYDYDSPQSVIMNADHTMERALSIEFMMLDFDDSGIYVDLFSPHIEKLSKERRLKGIDITTLCNMLVGDPTYLTDNQPVKNTLLARIKASSRSGGKFVIDSTQISCSFASSKYLSSTNVQSWQKKLVGSSGASGRELIFKVGNRYKHFFHHFSELVPVELKEDVDEGFDFDHTKLQWLPVEIKTYKGFTTMCMLNSDVPVQIFTHVELVAATVKIYTKVPLEYDEALLQDLGLSMTSVFTPETVVSAMEIKTGRQDMDWEFADEDEGPIDLDNNLIMVPDNESELDLEEWSDAEDEVEVSDSEAEDSDADDSEGDEVIHERVDEPPDYRPLTETRLLMPSRQQLVSISHGDISRLPMSMVRTASQRMKKNFSHGYELTLPVKMLKERYCDEDSITGVISMLSSAREMGEQEGVWLSDYISDSVRNFPPVRAQLIIRENAHKIGQETDDEDEDDYEKGW
jgi:hypothetical protein